MLSKNQPGRLVSPALHPDLAGSLQALRRRRGFDVERCVAAKTALLDAYLTSSGLQACVVGVSGGVDSAVTLALACRVAAQPGSPIREVVAALIPMFVSDGATNQDIALARGREVAERFGARCLTVDLSSSHGAVKGAVDAALGTVGGPWASGQLVSYLRTPALYYLASLLTQQGSPSLLLGTTNRDEGAYIGFFGKASDGMVDIQLISDLHKSEVYAVARYLGVPASVIDATPTGDVFDGRTDEEMIGASYDFIELYTLYLTLGSDAARSRLEESWSEEARRQFQELGARLEALHGYNAHKYLGGSPAIHLDIHERAVPGGWRRDVEPVAPAPSPRAAWVGEFTLAPATLARLDPRRDIAPRREPIQDFGDSAFLVHDLLAPDECAALRADLTAQSWVPVGQNGMLRGFDPQRDVIGSRRATSFEPRVADLLWDRLAGRIPMLRTMRDDTPTDWQSSRVWRAVGINPLLRFIEYRRGGLLVPHYDAPYEASSGRRTLMSVLVYLSDSKGEADRGATRLLVDPQRNRPPAEREYADWPSPEPSDSLRVLFRVPPRKGSALVLDHRVLHDADAHERDSPKLLLRTDVLFEPCGVRAGKSTSASVPAPRLPLWEKLALAPGATRAQVDDAYRRLPPAERAQPESRLAWKVLRDPFYASAYPHLLTEEKLERAGFFDDRASIEADNTRRLHPSWLVTPVHKVVERLRRGAATDAALDRRLVVLVTTGALCPVHSGHLEMMELARHELERRGDLVLGGYLSPSHDAYVSIKCGAQTLSAAHRVSLCEDAVRTSDWLMADRWEACENDGELNFTDVLYRLEDYLAVHVRCHRPIHIVYVFGGDNARFVRTFLERGACVCINRPGYEDRVSEVRADPRIAQNPAIVFVDEPTEPPGISSSSARLGDYSHLDERVRATFQAWSERRDTPPAPPRQAIFYLRDEGTFSILPWAANRALPQLDAIRRDFLARLASLIAAEFLAASAPDAPLAVEVRLLDLAAQRLSAAGRTAGKRVLSLDACIPGDLDLGLSRGFPLSGGKEPSQIVARPGFAPLAEQLAAIPAGEYTLLDDDTVTGETIERVLALLPEKLHIQEVVILFQMASLSQESPPSLDIGDCRDFLAGSREGGLVVLLPSGETARAPYVLPYVSPSARASLPISREVSFSIGVWALNEAFFRQISPPLLLSDADPAFQTLMRYAGFTPDEPMEAICQWHLERLKV